MQKECTRCFRQNYTNYVGKNFMCEKCLIFIGKVQYDSCGNCNKLHKKSHKFIGVSYCKNCRELEYRECNSCGDIHIKNPNYKGMSYCFLCKKKKNNIKKEEDNKRKKDIKEEDNKIEEDNYFLKIIKEQEKEINDLKHKNKKRKEEIKNEKKISAMALELLDKFTKLPYVKSDPFFNEYVDKFEEFIFEIDGK